MLVAQKGELKGKAIAFNLTEIPEALFESLIPDFEPNRQRLLDMGMTPQAVDVLARFLVKHDVKPFIEQTAAYLHVSTVDVIKWFNERDPAWLQVFAKHGIAFIQPDANGNYSQDPAPTPMYISSRAYRVMGSIADMVRYAATHGNPMPDRRGAVTAAAEVPAAPPKPPVPENVAPPPAQPVPPPAQIAPAPPAAPRAPSAPPPEPPRRGDRLMVADTPWR